MQEHGIKFSFLRRILESEAPVENLRPFPNVFELGFASGETEAVINRFASIEMNDNVFLRVNVVECRLIVRIQASDRPNSVHWRIESEFLVTSIA